MASPRRALQYTLSPYKNLVTAVGISQSRKRVRIILIGETLLIVGAEL
jgi:hypothetical protein